MLKQEILGWISPWFSTLQLSEIFQMTQSKSTKSQEQKINIFKHCHYHDYTQWGCRYILHIIECNKKRELSFLLRNSFLFWCCFVGKHDYTYVDICRYERMKLPTFYIPISVFCCLQFYLPPNIIFIAQLKTEKFQVTVHWIAKHFHQVINSWIEFDKTINSRLNNAMKCCWRSENVLIKLALADALRVVSKIAMQSHPCYSALHLEEHRYKA